MMCVIFSLYALAIFHLQLSDGAGFTSHNTFARRSSQFEYFGPQSDQYNTAAFYGLARDRSDAIQGGAPYPDYLYACGSDHDAGEEAHWTPFQIAAANYIREVYPDWSSQTRDMDGPGLVAFFLGVTSHYISDMNWHGLETIPSGEGIIRNMGFADFNCTNGDLCQTAHTAADTGGEFAAAYLLNISWYPTKWYIPVDDLVNIYKLVNIEVKDTWIRECGVVFYAGSFAVSHFGDILYDLVMAKRVGGLLLETYIDFPVGGIDDNAAWTGFMWNRFAKWVSEGPPETYPNRRLSESDTHEPVPASAIRRKLSQRKFTRGVREALLKQGVLPLSNHMSINTERSVSEQTQSTYDPLFKVSTQSGSKASFIGLRDKLTNLPTKGSKATSTLGAMMKDKKRIGEQRTRDQLLLRALADTLVEDYVLHSGNEDMDEVEKIELSDIDMSHLKSELYTRVDRILDQQYDTGATEPSSKLESSGSHQSDHKHSGNGKGKGIPISIPPIKGEKATVEATVVISGTAPHEYMGSAVTVGDFSGTGKNCDILVGSYGSGVSGGPQQGSAQILFNAACSSPSVTTNTLQFVGAVTASDHLPGYERFGFATEACDINLDGSLDIIVCAPSFGGRNVSAAAGNYSGRCDFFLGPFSPADTTLSSSIPIPDFSIFGDRIWGLFGSMIKVGDVDKDGKNDIIISAHAAGSYPDIAANSRGDLSSQGAVYIFLASSFSTLFNKHPQDPRTVTYQASDIASYTLQRPVSFQWFGKAIEIVETTSKLDTNLLLIGAPFYHSEQPDEINSAVGRVFAYVVPRKPASSSVKTLDYSWTVTGSHHAGRTGCSLSYSPSTGLLAIGESAYNSTLDISIPLASEYSKIPVEGVLRSGRVLVASLSAIQNAATASSNRDLLIKDIETWADKSKATFLAPIKPSFDARFGSSVKFHTSVETGKEQLLVSAPFQFNGAGNLFGYDVTFKLVTPILIKPSWSVSGRDVGEKRGRIGYTFVPYSVTDDATGAVADAVLVSGPFSLAGGIAPDGDQLGTLFSLQIIRDPSTAEADSESEVNTRHWLSHFIDFFYYIGSLLTQWFYSM